jgi:glutamate formiminotransferase / 5-formyltetrahydrofolate cyclo-ligase
MPVRKKIIECVPNFSEGRNREIMESIVAPFRTFEGVKLLDYQSDKDHNRMVVTVIGEPASLQKAVVAAVGKAVALIDLRKHTGQHPRMGAADVIPFIPIRNVDMAEAVELSREIAGRISEAFDLPVFLYEESATAPHRKNLAVIRKGQFEGMAQKMRQPEWRPDFGPVTIHPSAGVTAVGVRMPLVAFNINLDTENLEIADAIARRVRFITGGLRYCKAIGVELKDRGIVQVSMNMTDFTKTALYQSFELVRMEARRYGVNVVGSEIIGLVPMAALIDCAVYYLGVEDFSPDQVLESHLME